MDRLLTARGYVLLTAKRLLLANRSHVASISSAVVVGSVKTAFEGGLLGYVKQD